MCCVFVKRIPETFYRTSQITAVNLFHGKSRFMASMFVSVKNIWRFLGNITSLFARCKVLWCLPLVYVCRWEIHCSRTFLDECACYSGAPKILLDSLQREITAPVGEPYRIRIPFKGSPAPTASWYNVRIRCSCTGRLSLFKYCERNFAYHFILCMRKLEWWGLLFMVTTDDVLSHLL